MSAFTHPETDDYNLQKESLNLFKTNALDNKLFNAPLFKVPIDYRFSSQTNQEGYCWTTFNEYLLCQRKRGEYDKECDIIINRTRSVCPIEWIDAWNEQRQNGTFLGISDTKPKMIDSGPYGPKRDAALKAKLNIH